MIKITRSVTAAITSELDAAYSSRQAARGSAGVGWGGAGVLPATRDLEGLALLPSHDNSDVTFKLITPLS